MNNLIVIPVLAVCSCLFLFIAFLAAKQTKLMKRFLIAYKAKKHTFFVSRGVCYGAAALIASVIFSFFIGPFNTFLETKLGLICPSSTYVAAVTFTLATTVLYNVMKKFIDTVFIQDEVNKSDNLREFSISVSKNLHLEEIFEDVVCVIQKTIPVKNIYAFVLNEEDKFYYMIQSNTSLLHKDIRFNADNAAMEWLYQNEQCLLLKKFRTTKDYSLMDSVEINNLEIMNVECLVPIKVSKELVGVVMLSDKYNGSGFTFSDISFLDSIDSVASIAVKNSKLYKKAKLEARTDELTGLLNRKYFYLTIHEQVEKLDGDILSLVILNVDDFKLYNQLFGNKEGDRALTQIGAIIKDVVGDKGYVARYSGKEFAIILPHFHALEAQKLAETIRLRILNLNKLEKDYALKVLTVSGGVCSIPGSAATVKQLVEYCDLSVYYAKQQGKNKILVFSKRDMNGNQEDNTSNIYKTGFKEGAYKTSETTIYALTAAIDAKDHYTFHHCENVAYYATALAREYGLNNEMVEIIREAALLHDIGKIGIAENILNKKGSLTEDEFEIMKSHVEQSISIIRHLPSLDYVIPAVIGHHERYDGNGYPRRIGGEDIPLSARILCIADSFDAMVSRRSYKTSYSVEFAVEELKMNAGKQFDPHLSELFIKMLKAGKIMIRSREKA